MNKPIIITLKFDTMIWLLLKSWGLGISAFGVLMAVLFTSEIDMTLETATLLKVVVTFIMGFLFLVLSATLFSLPLIVLAGILAYVFDGYIWRHPWITTCIVPFVGFVMFELTTHIFAHANDASFWGTIMANIFSTHGIITLCALCVAAGFYSFKMRTQMMALGRS
jgi:hypothetical protein